MSMGVISRLLLAARVNFCNKPRRLSIMGRQRVVLVVGSTVLP